MTKTFKWFRHKYKCNCGDSFCSSCLKPLPEIPWFDDNPFESLGIIFANPFWSSKSLCQVCWEKHIEKIDIKIKAKKSNADFMTSHVEVFPSTYKGKIPKLLDSEERSIGTKYFRNRQKAEDQIRYISAYHNFDLIYNQKWHRKTDSEESESGRGTHYYSRSRQNKLERLV